MADHALEHDDGTPDDLDHDTTDDWDPVHHWCSHVYGGACHLNQ